MIEAPIFLVGAERSGTTLLRLMLDHHPEIAFQHEFEFVVNCVGDDGTFPDLKQFYQYLAINRVFRAFGVFIDPELDYRALVNSFLVQKRDRSGKRLVGATVHDHFDRLLSIWPDARFIHLLRDGRDVAKSRIAMGWNGNMWTASHNWMVAEQLWDSLEQRLDPNAHTSVRYEQLVEQPEQTLAQLCEFIGVEYDPAMLAIDRNTTYSRPDPKLSSRWRSTLSTREIQLAEARMGPMLKKRGYELSGVQPWQFSRSRDALLRFQCRLSRATFRLRRFGPRLTILDSISRRIGPEALRRRVHLQLNEVTARHLK